MEGAQDICACPFVVRMLAVHYLVALLDTILKHLERNGAYVNALFAHIVKAFDSLDHNVVGEEAKFMGACSFVVHMLASFLFKRSYEDLR